MNNELSVERLQAELLLATPADPQTPQPETPAATAITIAEAKAIPLPRADAPVNGVAPGPNHSGSKKEKTKTRQRPSQASETESEQAEPAYFRVDAKGLCHLEQSGEEGEETKSWMWVSGPIKALGFGTDQYGKGSSLVLEFTDLYGASKAHVLPRSTFTARSGEQVVRSLLDDGLALSPNKKAPSLLRQYLMQCRPALRFLLMNKPGWYGRSYALPDCIFGQQGNQRIFYQTHPSSQQLLGVCGTFNDWIAAIGTHARGNSRLLFGISMGFAAPLLYLTGEESGVFHVRCGSSKGKSTLLMVAGSVCGGGGPLGYARSWLMTANAVETTCESCNDLLLPLDELKLCDPKVAGRVAYMIASGQGKGRSGWSQNSTMTVPTTTRRTIGLSSGEISLQTHVEAAAESLYGGQLVRFAEIQAIANPDLGIFDRIPDGFSSAGEFAEKLKGATARYYGWPLRNFLDAVTAHRDQHAKDAADIVAAFTAEVVPKGASSEVHRTARRFGLVVAGGIAATKDKCTDWDCDEVWDGGVSVFRDWMAGRGSLAAADEERAVQQVRSRIAANLAKFVDLAGDTTSVRDQLGYRKRVVEAGEHLVCFLIWPDTWATTFCKGLDPQFTAGTLHDRRFLVSDPGRLQYSSRIPGFDRPKKFYAVRETIMLEGDEKILLERDE